MSDILVKPSATLLAHFADIGQPTGTEFLLDEELLGRQLVYEAKNNPGESADEVQDKAIFHLIWSRYCTPDVNKGAKGESIERTNGDRIVQINEIAKQVREKDVPALAVKLDAVKNQLIEGCTADEARADELIQLIDANFDELHGKILYMSDREQEWRFDFASKLWKLLYGLGILLVLLIASVLFASKAHGQQAIDGVRLKEAGVAKGQVAGGFLTLNFNSGCTLTRVGSSNEYTIDCSGGAGDDLGGATYADVVALWAACSSGYLKFDGTCDSPAGAGTVTHTAGALTATHLALGNGAADITVSPITDNGTEVNAAGYRFIAAEYDSDVANGATNGTIRLAKTDFIAWRNNANGANVSLSLNASDQIAATTFAGALVGNASTATALAANGANCSGNNFALGVDASGVGECAQPAFSNLSGSATDAQIPNTITIDLAATATALAADPADCSADNFATAINASGTLTCATLASIAGNVTLFDSANASRTVTFGLSGATDPVLSIGNNSFDVSTGVLKYGGNTVATSANNLSFFSSTTSAQLLTLLSDEVGSGSKIAKFDSVSGNSGVAAQSSGTLTSGNCAKFDANGNIVDHGSACGGSGSPGGSDTYVQFNDGSAFGGDADFVWDKTLNVLTLGTAPSFTFEYGAVTQTADRGMRMPDSDPVAGPLNCASIASGICTVDWPGKTGTGAYVRAGTPTITTPDFTTGFTIGTAAASGKIPIGNGTNYVASANTFPNASATSGKYIKSDGTNWIASTGSASGTGACTNQVATTLNSDAAPTCSTVASTMADSSIKGVGVVSTSSVNATAATDVQLLEITLPSSYFNTANQVMDVAASGTWTTGTTQTPTWNYKIKVCTVSGCGSGTVVTAISCTSAASTASTTQTWILRGTIGTTATGGSGTLVSHGFCDLPVGSSANTIFSGVHDVNTAASGAIALNGVLYLHLSFQASTQSGTKNSSIGHMLHMKPVD